MTLLIIDAFKRFLTIAVLLVIKTPGKFISTTFTIVKTLIGLTLLNALDFIIFTLNLFLPRKAKGSVVAKGDAGYGGIWPQFIAPTPSDSRSPCPYLNAMANHGIINRSGRAISMDQLRPAIMKTLNTSITLTTNTVKGVESLFGKSVIDLSDLSRHGVIEHDASVLRADTYFQPDQSIPTKPLITDLLKSASRPKSSDHPEGALSPADIAKFASKCIAESKQYNPEFTGLSAFHTLFMCNNLSLLFDTVDGDVKALRTILLEERFPDGFETWYRHRLGYSLLEMNSRSVEIYLRMSGDSL